MKKKYILMILLFWVLSCRVFAAAVALTSQGLGLSVGSQGNSVTVEGAFTVSARTLADSPGGYNNANVWVNSLGMGVRGGWPPMGNVGLDALQGSNDELIFNFETTLSVDSIVISLNGYNRNVDGTTFRLVDAYDGSEILLSDAEWSSAITLDAANSTVIGLGRLFPDNDGMMLASLAVSQTAGSVYVSSIDLTASGVAEVPEPTTIAFLGAGCLMFVRKKKA